MSSGLGGVGDEAVDPLYLLDCCCDRLLVRAIGLLDLPLKLLLFLPLLLPEVPLRVPPAPSFFAPLLLLLLRLELLLFWLPERLLLWLLVGGRFERLLLLLLERLLLLLLERLLLLLERFRLGEFWRWGEGERRLVCCFFLFFPVWRWVLLLFPF